MCLFTKLYDLIIIIHKDNNYVEKIWNEELTRLEFSFEGKANAVKELIKEKDLEVPFKDDAIGVTVNLSGMSYDYTKFLQNYNQSTINQDTIINLTIVVNKSKDFDMNHNSYLFFKMDTFDRSFSIPKKFEEVFQIRDKSFTLNIYLPIENNYSNDFMNLKPLTNFRCRNDEVLSLNDFSKKRLTTVCNLRNELGRIEEYYPIPEYFYFKELEEELNYLINKYLFNMCLLHLANKVNQESILIRGFTNIDLIMGEKFSPSNYEIIYRLYKFSYDEKHYLDKVEICRNVITSYIPQSASFSDLDSLLPKIDKTVRNHFSIYIQDNIKKFFDNTKDAVNEAHKFAIEARAEANQILNSLNRSMMGLFTVAFSAALAQTRGIFIFFMVAVVFHAIYFGFTYQLNRKHAIHRRNSIIKSFNRYINNFSNIDKDEVKKIKRQYIKPAIINIDNNIKRYWKVTKWLIFLMIASFVLALYFKDSLVPKTVSVTPKYVVVNHPKKEMNLYKKITIPSFLIDVKEAKNQREMDTNKKE